MAEETTKKVDSKVLPAVGQALDEIAAHPKKSDAAASADSRWKEPAQRLRATTRWGLAVFGTIGVAFLVAAPLTGLQDLVWPSLRAGFALASTIILALGVVLAVSSGSEVFISRAGTLSDLEDGYRGGKLFGMRYARYEVFGGLASGRRDLVKKWEQARDERDRADTLAAIMATAKGDGPFEAFAGKRAALGQKRFEEIDAISTNAVTFAAYRELVRVFRWSQRWVVVGALLVFLGVFVFFASVQSGDDSSSGSSNATQTPPVVVAGVLVSGDQCPQIPGLPLGRPAPSGNEIYVLTAAGCQKYTFPLPRPVQSAAPTAANTSLLESPLVQMLLPPLAAIVAGSVLWIIHARQRERFLDRAFEDAT